LRHSAPLQDCIFNGDLATTTYHLGLISRGDIQAIVSLMENPDHDIIDLDTEEKIYQLRGMAVHPDNQGQGLGKNLLKHTLDFARQHGIDMIWCNAREKACTLYEKQGFHYASHSKNGIIVKKDESFDIPRIGPHYKMYKILKQ
jgi:GNAT superfamily N-acetyltransferase